MTITTPYIPKVLKNIILNYYKGLIIYENKFKSFKKSLKGLIKVYKDEYTPPIINAIYPNTPPKITDFLNTLNAIINASGINLEYALFLYKNGIITKKYFKNKKYTYYRRKFLSKDYKILLKYLTK